MCSAPYDLFTDGSGDAHSPNGYWHLFRFRLSDEYTYSINYDKRNDVVTADSRVSRGGLASVLLLSAPLWTSAAFYAFPVFPTSETIPVFMAIGAGITTGAAARAALPAGSTGAESRAARLANSIIGPLRTVGERFDGDWEHTIAGICATFGAYLKQTYDKRPELFALEQI